jgi:hypothetical protein
MPHFPGSYQIYHSQLRHSSPDWHYSTIIKILNWVVYILLRVLDQVQGFPSNTTLFQKYIYA